MRQPGWEGEGIFVEERGSRGTVLIPDLDLDAEVHIQQGMTLNSPARLRLAEVRLPELAVGFQVVR
jgi:hypothetical protein